MRRIFQCCRSNLCKLLRFLDLFMLIYAVVNGGNCIEMIWHLFMYYIRYIWCRAIAMNRKKKEIFFRHCAEKYFHRIFLCMFFLLQIVIRVEFSEIGILFPKRGEGEIKYVTQTNWTNINTEYRFICCYCCCYCSVLPLAFFAWNLFLVFIFDFCRHFKQQAKRYAVSWLK